MSRTNWYLLGFILTVSSALILWFLAALVYLRDRKSYLNKALALSMICMGFWAISGFAEKILPTPNDTFTLWTYRWAYAAGVLTSILFMTFSLILYSDRYDHRKYFLPLFIIGLAISILCFSPLVITRAIYRNDNLTSQNGPLYPLASFSIIIPTVLSIYLIFRKWSRSTGIDRARTSIILLSIVIFFPIFALCIFILPAITGSDIFTNYAFIAGFIPIASTAYTIIRLRLLDVRLILRKTSVLLLGTVIFSAPLVLLLFILSKVSMSSWVEQGLILISFMVLIFFAPDAWKFFQRLSSRLFFSELYDELELLEGLSSKLASNSELRPGLNSAISELIKPLGLQRLEVIVSPEVTGGKSWLFKYQIGDDGEIAEHVDLEHGCIDWLREVDTTLVAEELQRWSKDNAQKNLGNRMTETGLSACIPMRAASEKVGYLLVGEKVSRRALSSTDISFLEKVGDRLGLYIDNYALSTRLRAQLEELAEVYKELQEADRFKSEIIMVTSHEFRTPVTIVHGYAQTLLEGWNSMDEELKREILDKMIVACDRITHLTEQFFTVSQYQEGEVRILKKPIRVKDILEHISLSLSPEDQERLIFEANQDFHIFSDPEHLFVVLDNIVSNALRFSPAEKPVIVRIWRNSSNDYIQVKDFGEGIPFEDHQKVFEPFVRLEDLRHHSKGMGLGLHIVRLLSAKLGVEVEIDSSPELGTAVTLVISLM